MKSGAENSVRGRIRGEKLLSQSGKKDFMRLVERDLEVR